MTYRLAVNFPSSLSCIHLHDWLRKKSGIFGKWTSFYVILQYNRLSLYRSCYYLYEPPYRIYTIVRVEYNSCMPNTFLIIDENGKEIRFRAPSIGSCILWRNTIEQLLTTTSALERGRSISISEPADIGVGTRDPSLARSPSAIYETYSTGRKSPVYTPSITRSRSGSLSETDKTSQFPPSAVLLYSSTRASAKASSPRQQSPPYKRVENQQNRSSNAYSIRKRPNGSESLARTGRSLTICGSNSVSPSDQRDLTQRKSAAYLNSLKSPEEEGHSGSLSMGKRAFNAARKSRLFSFSLNFGSIRSPDVTNSNTTLDSCSSETNNQKEAENKNTTPTGILRQRVERREHRAQTENDETIDRFSYIYRSLKISTSKETKKPTDHQHKSSSLDENFRHTDTGIGTMEQLAEADESNQTEEIMEKRFVSETENVAGRRPNVMLYVPQQRENDSTLSYDPHSLTQTHKKLEEYAKKHYYVIPDRGLETLDAKYETEHGTPIVWKYHIKPNYTLLDLYYLTGKTTNWRKDSTELNVENLMKRFEMEVTHKHIYQWTTVNVDKFTLEVNNGPPMSCEELSEQGKLLILLSAANVMNSFMDYSYITDDSFVWELLQLFTTYPRYAFSWRQWGYLNTKTFHRSNRKKKKINGKYIEFNGVTVVQVDENQQITKMEYFFKAEELNAVFRDLIVSNPVSDCSAKLESTDEEYLRSSIELARSS